MDRMKALREQGMGFDRIAQKLNQEDIKPRRGKHLLALSPGGLLVVLSVWIVVLLLGGYVSVASIVASLSFAPVAWFLTSDPERTTLALFGIVAGLFIVFTHRSNLRNLMTGKEHCFQKIRLLPGP